MNSPGERRSGLLWVLGILALYRCAAHVRVPWINVAFIESRLQPKLPASSMLMASDLWRFGLVMLGVSPYIAAASFLALGTLIVPNLERLHKSGPSGAAKLAKWTAVLSIVLAFLASLSIVSSLGRLGPAEASGLYDSGPGGIYIIVLAIVAGYSLLLFFISRLGLYGFGSGVGLIILANTLASVPRTIVDNIERVRGSGFPVHQVLMPTLLLVLLMGACILLEPLFVSSQTCIACLCFAVSIVDVVGLGGSSIGELEPQFVKLTRIALERRQPLRYVLLLVLVTGFWMLLHSVVLRQQAERRRSSAIELVAGVALGLILAASDIILSGVDVSRLPVGLSPQPNALHFLTVGYAPYGPNGASFLISVFACIAISKAYPERLSWVAAVFARFKRKSEQTTAMQG